MGKEGDTKFIDEDKRSEAEKIRDKIKQRKKERKKERQHKAMVIMQDSVISKGENVSNVVSAELEKSLDVEKDVSVNETPKVVDVFASKEDIGVIPGDLESAYLNSIANKKEGKNNLEKWKRELAKKTEEKDYTDEWENKILILGHLAKKQGPMGELARKVSNNEVNCKFGNFFGKDLYDGNGGSIRIVGTENGKLKFLYKKNDTEDEKIVIKYANFITLKKLLEKYSENRTVIKKIESEKNVKGEIIDNKKNLVEPEPGPKTPEPLNDDKKAADDAVSSVSSVGAVVVPSVLAAASLLTSEGKDAPVDSKAGIPLTPDEIEKKIEPIATPAVDPKIAEGIEKEKVEKERGVELARLQTEVERARKGYATKDYEVSTVFSRIKKIFGGHLRSTSGNHQETHDQHEAYQAALKNLLTYQVADLREKNFPPEKLNAEIERLTKYYNQDEKINLYGARTDARAEAWEKKYGKLPGWFAKKGTNFVNWYRKLNWKTKAVFGAAGVLSGAGLIMIGQRILGGTATGAGVTAMIEARYRRKESMRLEEERFIIEEDLKKVENPEEKYSALMARMQEEMNGYRDNLKTERIKARERKLFGVMVGLFIGGGVMSDLLKWGHAGYSHFFGNNVVDNIPKPVPNTISPVEADVPPATAPEVAHKILDTSNVHNEAVVPSETVVAPGASLTGVEIAQKGDSVWKMIGKHIVDNKEFSSLDPLQKTYVIDALKDRVAEHHTEFGFNNIDKIKIGDKLDFSKLIHSETDFHSIIEHAKNLTPEQLKNIGHNNETILHWVENHHGQSLTSPKVEEILANATHDHAGSSLEQVSMPDHQIEAPTHEVADAQVDHIKPELTAPTTIDHPVGSESPVAEVPIEQKIPVTESALNSADKIADASLAVGAGVVAGAVGAKIVKDNIINFPTVAERVARKRQKVDLENLKEFNKLAKKYNFVSGEEFIFRAKKSIQAISLNSLENWRVMKEIKFSELEEKNGKISVKLVKNIRNLEKYLVSFLGTEVKSRKDESVKGWISRVTKKSLEEENASGIKKAA